MKGTLSNRPLIAIVAVFTVVSAYLLHGNPFGSGPIGWPIAIIVALVVNSLLAFLLAPWAAPYLATTGGSAGSDRRVSESTYHQSFWAEASPRKGQSLFPAQAINHTDEEMEMLAALVRQRTAWQITGMKGPKDGRGYQYEKRPAPVPKPNPGHEIYN